MSNHRQENILFPGRPNYTGPTSGLFAFIHHRELFEYSDNIWERIHHIERFKPVEERRIRLYNLMYLDESLFPKLYTSSEKELLRLRSYWCGTYTAVPEYNQVLSHIKENIPDNHWDEENYTLRFPKNWFTKAWETIRYTSNPP